MPQIRQPAVAGLFYPHDPDELGRMVDGYLAVAKAHPAPKAIIAPHAGYIYSGPVAATAYAALRNIRDRITRVVLLGPSHRAAFTGLAVPEADLFRTPLGDVPVAQEALELIADLPQVFRSAAAHAAEHSLEVHLPFLQRILGDFRLVPLVVGDETPERVAEVLERLWGGDETLIVVSSDLSHYHGYERARNMDRATSDAIEALSPEGVGEEDACGRVPVRGLLRAARAHGLHAETVDLRNSGDTAGPRNQVVGYGAYLFH